MLSHSTFYKEINSITEKVQELAFYPYASKFVHYPPIDLLSLHFTYLFLTSMGCSKEVKETYGISQVLIQMGLDSHDQVGLEPVKDKELIKNRQLTVLAGDLFSGYYAYFLAMRQEIELIKRWAQVTQNLNILKMKMHAQKEELAPAEQREALLEGKKSLTGAVFQWFEAAPIWHELHTAAQRLYLMAEQGVPHQDLENVSMIYQEKIAEIEEEWLKQELMLWLDMAQEKLVVKEH